MPTTSPKPSNSPSPPVPYTDCDQRVLERNGILALDGASDRIDGFARGGFLEQRPAVGYDGFALGARNIGESIGFGINSCASMA